MVLPCRVVVRTPEVIYAELPAAGAPGECYMQYNIFIITVIITLKVSSVSLYDAWNHRAISVRAAVTPGALTFTPSSISTASVLSVLCFWLL